MLYGFLFSILIIDCLLLVLIVLIQQGKSSMGLGSLGGGTQMLFGGSGGQDLFQKITWILGAVFMGFSLLLSLMKSSYVGESRYLKQAAQVAQQQVQQLPMMAQEMPAAQESPYQAAPEKVEIPVVPAAAE